MGEERLSGLAMMQIRCTEVLAAAAVIVSYCNYIIYKIVILACRPGNFILVTPLATMLHFLDSKLKYLTPLPPIKHAALHHSTKTAVKVGIW